MKKIICTVTNDLTYDQRMIRICTSLAKAGYDVTLAGRQLPWSLPLAKQAFGQHRFRLIFNHGKLFYLEYNLRLLFWLLFSKFDIAHSVDLDTLGPGYLAARLRSKICVYDAHEYFTEVPEVVERPAVKKTWETLARWIIPRLKFACTVCESLAEVFEKKYGTPFTVIRNVPTAKPLPPEDFDKKNHPFILFYQGVLNDGRGLEEAIEAMVMLENVELWLAGEGDLSGELRQLAMEKGVESRVKFLGKILPEELEKLTPKAHLGLNLLKNKGLNYYYSLANKAFDYIQAGLPSLNMDFPEYRRINRHHEVFLLLEQLDPASIVQAVESLRSDPELYQKLSANCRKAAPVYTWENEEQILLSFYEKI
jgi:glycosyltransferase involved in cell wall biosynthesis